MKPTALEKFLKNHKPACAVHIYSGDRHCSCGRDAAEKEYLGLIELAHKLTWKLPVAIAEFEKKAEDKNVDTKK
jgi:hypothetical protein